MCVVTDTLNQPLQSYIESESHSDDTKFTVSHCKQICHGGKIELDNYS